MSTPTMASPPPGTTVAPLPMPAPLYDTATPRPCQSEECSVKKPPSAVWRAPGRRPRGHFRVRQVVQDDVECQPAIASPRSALGRDTLHGQVHRRGRNTKHQPGSTLPRRIQPSLPWDVGQRTGGTHNEILDNITLQRTHRRKRIGLDTLEDNRTVTHLRVAIEVPTCRTHRSGIAENVATGRSDFN